MDAQTLFRHLRRIQIHTSLLANDQLAGAYRSAFKGKGMEFEEVREYVVGDEMRSIDWNVTARMNHPYVKHFREERELAITLVVDISASTRFGTQNCSKRERISEIAAVLAFSALKNHDKVGLIQFSEEVDHYFPPKKGDRHILRLIRELWVQPPSKASSTNIQAVLTFLGKVQKKSGICFLISDFICPDFSQAIAPLMKRLDMIAIAVTDPREARLPPMGLATFKDLETGEMRTVDSQDPELQKSYATHYYNRLDSLRALMQKQGGGFLSVATNDNMIYKLRQFFRSREGQWH